MRQLGYALLVLAATALILLGVSVAGWRAAATPSGTKAELIRVDKSERRLELLRGGEVIRHYHISMGSNPNGHKQQEGDERTPEGRYRIDWRNPDSKFHKSLRITYPNAQDRRAAQTRGVPPGGDIFIHGMPNGWGWAWLFFKLFDWTDGCIAVNDREMDEIWEMVPVGTPVEIRP